MMINADGWVAKYKGQTRDGGDFWVEQALICWREDEYGQIYGVTLNGQRPCNAEKIGGFDGYAKQTFVAAQPGWYVKQGEAHASVLAWLISDEGFTLKALTDCAVLGPLEYGDEDAEFVYLPDGPVA